MEFDPVVVLQEIFPGADSQYKVLIARMGDGCPHGSGVSDLGIHKEERRQPRTRHLVLLILLGRTCCLFHIGYMTAMHTSSMDDDDNKGIHRHDDAPHMVQLGFNLVYCIHRLWLSAASSIASSPFCSVPSLPDLSWRGVAQRGYMVSISMSHNPSPTY